MRNEKEIRNKIAFYTNMIKRQCKHAELYKNDGNDVTREKAILSLRSSLAALVWVLNEVKQPEGQ